MFTLTRVGSSGTVMISMAAIMMGAAEAKADRYRAGSCGTRSSYVSYRPSYYAPPTTVTYAQPATYARHVPICSEPAYATTRAVYVYDAPRVRYVKPVRYQRTRYFREYRRPHRQYRADRRHAYRVREQYRPHHRRHRDRGYGIGFGYGYGRRDGHRHHGGLRIRIGR